MLAVQSINFACTDFWSPYLAQMGAGIRQSVADVDTDSLLSQNWPPSPPVRGRSCSETDSATMEKRGRKKTEKYARNATEFLISVDLGKVWPPLVYRMAFLCPFFVPKASNTKKFRVQRSFILTFQLGCTARNCRSKTSAL